MTKLSNSNWRNAPGPGDLDPGPVGCLGGACPHDHPEWDEELEEDYDAMDYEMLADDLKYD